MDTTTLKRANELNQKIKEYSEALNCFEWESENEIKVSTNPHLIIEFDGEDGREQIKLPMNLSDVMVGFLKQEIIKGRQLAVDAFNAL